MKYILFLFLIAPFLTQAQTQSFNKVTYYFFSTDSTVKSFERGVAKQLNVTVDTNNRKVIIPRLEMTEASFTRRDIVRNIYSSGKDTSLIVQNYNEAFTMFTRRTRYVDVGIKCFDFTDGTTGMQLLNYFVITYAAANKFIKCIVFER